MLINTATYGEIQVEVEHLGGRMLLAKCACVVGEKEKEDIIRVGHILMPRWQTDGKHADLYYAHFRSIFDARRSLIYTLAGWNHRSTGEIDRLAHEIDQIQWVSDQLVGFNGLPETLKSCVLGELAHLVASLKSKSNSHNARARALIKRASELRDSLGRMNPGKSRMQASYASLALVAREGEIASMQPFVGKREATVAALAGVQVAILWGVRNWLKELLEIKSFSMGTIKPAQYVALDREISVVARALSGLRVEPFLSLRDFTIGNLLRARGLLRRMNVAEARNELEGAYNGVRSKLAAVWLENTHAEVGMLARGIIPEEDCSRIAKQVAERLREVRDKLSWLDDSRFVEPTLVRARDKLELAAEQLKGGYIQEAKQTVRDVSLIL